LEGDKGGGKFCFGRAFWVSPSGGAEDELFPPQEGDLRERKVLVGASVGSPPLEELKMRCFPLWRGTKGEESFVSDESFGFPPLEGDEGG
jgi:hypothetical protein